MAENLNVGTRINTCNEGSAGEGNTCSSLGYTVQDQGVSCSSIEKYCYADSDAFCVSRGGLYQWNQAMCGSITAGATGVCPVGWHVPTHDEFTDLERQSCIDVGGSNCSTAFPKDVITTGARASSPPLEGTYLKVGGASGFNAELFGYRATAGGHHWNGGYTHFWSSNIAGTNGGWMRTFTIWDAYVFRSNNSADAYASYGMSIRCLQD